MMAATSETPPRIVVLGDAIRDVYIEGEVHGCQEGCAKFVERDRLEVPGGAGNAARSLSNWHVHTTLLTQTVHVPVKMRFMVRGECAWRYDAENLGPCQEDRDAAQRALEEGSFDAVLLSDYEKGFLTDEFIAYVIRLCDKRGVPCIVDAKRDPKKYEGAILKCNTPYADKYPGLSARASTIITCGPYRPVIVGCDDIESLRPVHCTNHIGAGDCFAAHLTLALAHGFSLPAATGVAYAAGRAYVQHPYNSPPTHSEILAAAR